MIESYSSKNSQLEYPYYEINGINYYYANSYRYNFSDVKGQENAKRAALITAAGMHNIIFEGTPGCGKSMIAKRLLYILPPSKLDEILYFATLDTLNSKVPTFSPLRPFLSPHHTSTQASIFGGGSHRAKIGEVGLSHGGVLFFDELPHFSKNILEALREPLEDRKIRISRVNSKVEYDASFLFVGAMNPCPCGNLLSRSIDCRCSDLDIKRYKSRLSDPFLDRVDLYVQMQDVNSSDKSSVSSNDLHKKVLEAFKIQMNRQYEVNGRLSEQEIDKYCILEDDAQDVLSRSIERYSLSFRAINKVKKVSRTIADLAGSNLISRAHLLEALSYRKR
jgi:magnesium chelatase family protein